jgi:hypothetical protein
MKTYKECYKLYCQAKRDIDETPLSYEDWKVLEKEARKEYRELISFHDFNKFMTREKE